MDFSICRYRIVANSAQQQLDISHAANDGLCDDAVT
jgi:hypothetical protein